jgi:beta-phosphoglucomutase
MLWAGISTDKRKKFRGAILDLDGVLVDTPKYHYEAWKRLAVELGFEFSDADNESVKGVSRERSLDILLENHHFDFDPAEKERLADKKNRWYLESIAKMDESALLPGVRSFLTALREKKAKLAVGSASRNASVILSQLNIAHLFDSVVDANRVSRTKPHPEVFTLAAREMELSPAECVVFEDAEAGLEAARVAGMFAVGIGKPETLKNANLVISAFTDLDIDALF